MKQFCTILAVFVALILPSVVEAASTVPQQLVYNGHLLNPSGTPITTSHTIRFSIWNSTDVQGSDVSGGTINGAAATYLGWQEEHTVTPDSNGYFSLELGSVTPLFSVVTLDSADLQSMYLQIEVKEAAEPNTSYEILDVRPTDDAIDRTPVLSVPFALNADYLDQREIGTGSGDIALLQDGGVFSPSVIPEGTFRDAFILDYDDSAVGDITLQFGNALAKTLVYDQVNSYFEFNDDVRIDGNLFVTGLINGVDISTLASSPASQLLVTSGAALTVNVSAGNYRLSGTTTEFAGAAGVALADDTTNYLYFTTAGLQVGASFPTDESIIRLATVVTSGGAIDSVNDARVFASDDRAKTTVVSLEPLYPQVSYTASGANHVGALKIEYDSGLDRNYYSWRSSKSTLQEYVVVVSVQLPNSFNQFNSPALELDYKTSSALAADNNIGIEVLDTTNTLVALGGATSNLANTNWTTTSIDFNSGTFTPGEAITVKLTVAAKDSQEAALSTLKLLYGEL